MPGAHGNTLLSQKMREIGVMHTLDNKTRQRQLRLAEQTNAVTGGKATQQIVMQRSLVGGHRVLIQTGQIIQRRT
ncbi:hypothetical protein D3C78_1905550 [compost metagenome]